MYKSPTIPHFSTNLLLIVLVTIMIDLSWVFELFLFFTLLCCHMTLSAISPLSHVSKNCTSFGKRISLLQDCVAILIQQSYHNYTYPSVALIIGSVIRKTILLAVYWYRIRTIMEKQQIQMYSVCNFLLMSILLHYNIPIILLKCICSTIGTIKKLT